MTAALLPGLPVTLGGVAYTMPSINARAAKAYWPRVEAMQNGNEPDPLGLVAEMVHACLLRNYPEITFDTVQDGVDMDNLDELSAKVFGKGAFRKWCDAQASEAGNAAAPPTLATAGTGAPSTPASPPPPVGDPSTSTP